MTGRIIISIIILMYAASLDAVQDIKISITSPQDNAEIDRPARTEGIVSDPDAQVHIIVHPVGVPEYWVQPRAFVHEDGKWTAKVYLGRPDISNPDKQYELMAIADPEQPVKVGDMLKEWPGSKWRSHIIRVKRRPSPNSTYYVQVGAMKNNNDAQKLLVKIKKYYPEAYIVVQNNFSKIRIPGVLTKKQGAFVSRDIEKKFNLKPMVVQKK